MMMMIFSASEITHDYNHNIDVITLNQM